MNKAELIDVLTKELKVDRRAATDAVESVVDTIVRAVHKGDSVTITGFGVFERRRRAARVARNPRTGETVKVKPTSVPAFRPGAQFKAVVSGAQRLPAEGPAVKRGSGAGGARKAAKKTAAKKTAEAGSRQEGSEAHRREEDGEACRSEEDGEACASQEDGEACRSQEDGEACASQEDGEACASQEDGEACRSQEDGDEAHCRQEDCEACPRQEGPPVVLETDTPWVISTHGVSACYGFD